MGEAGKIDPLRSGKVREGDIRFSQVRLPQETGGVESGDDLR